MIVDITEVFTIKGNSMNGIINWLHVNVGVYYGPGRIPLSERTEESLSDGTVIHIGAGWQISAITNVDSYGRTVNYELDIDDEKKCTFFILKFL